MADKNDNLIEDEMSEKIISVAESLVTQVGSNAITVRQILQKLDITNRVFYNRFHNIDEVLQVVYTNTTMKVRESISGGIADGRGVAAAFMLGAEGVQIGTRFLLANECSISRTYKEKLNIAFRLQLKS